MVLVFFLGVCCLLFLCVVHEVTVLVKKFKKFESTIVVEYSLESSGNRVKKQIRERTPSWFVCDSTHV